MPPITIVGAGLGGLTLALALARLGHSSLVLESAGTLGEVGAGISLPPNALKLFWRLGLRDTLEPLISVPEYGEIRHGETGAFLGKVPFGATLVENYGAPFAQIHRADLHNCLLDAVKNSGRVEIRTDAHVTSAALQPDGVQLELRSGESLAASVVVACDGIRSTLRDQLFTASEPLFTGHVAWRCLIPLDSLPEHLRERRSVVNVADHRQLVHYPVRNMSLLNCVAIVGESDWSIESWTERGDVDELLGYFEHFGEDCKTVLRAIPRDACHRWAIYDRDPISSWTTGRVALLGDAAHPMPPYLGQGAAMAVEDAFVLATALHEQPDVESAFSAYSELRIERANGSLEESRRAGHRFQDPGADSSRFDNDQPMQAKRLFAYEPQSPLHAN